MFNTKRIKALEEWVTEDRRFFNNWFNSISDRIRVMEKKEIPNIISCSTCKCLIRKEDAVSGESKIVEKHFGLDFKGNETIVEEIQKHFYCHSKDCKPKKLK